MPTGDTFSKHRYNRGLYFWVGMRELLPEAWRWYGACVQHATGTGNDKLELLGGSLLSRVTRALQERDEVHFALNQPSNNDTADEALGSLDTVLILLMGAVDARARVAHSVLNLPPQDEYNAAWQKKKWCKQITVKAPNLAAVVDPGTPSEHTLTILRLRRNSVHGAALQGVQYFEGNKAAETRIRMPSEDEKEIFEAMDAMGGCMSWGVRSLGAGVSFIQPALLVDKLFEEVVKLLNSLMKETPVESLPHVAITADTAKPPVDNPSRGKFDIFSEWNRMAIRWQLGVGS